MLVATVTCDTSRMLTLFCIGLVNQSPVGRSTSSSWLHNIAVIQPKFGYTYTMRLRLTPSSRIHCDEECRRFRRLLSTWPTDKPKAAVVLLLQPSVLETYARSSRLFSANFNDAYKYPVIVFHEEIMNTEAYRQQMRSFTNSSLYFQVRANAVDDQKKYFMALL